MFIQMAVVILSGQTPVITEVMANPLNEDATEFVEVFNPSVSPSDLAGFLITDGDALDEILPWDEGIYGPFPDSDAVTGTTSIPAGAYAVILETDYASAPAYDFPAGTIIITTGDASLCNGLAASTDPLTLFDATGTADSCAVSTYGTPIPSDVWSERDDDGLDGIPFDPGDGSSVERMLPSMPDQDGSWAAGPPGGSPGTGWGSTQGVDLSCTGVVTSETQPQPGSPFGVSAFFLYSGSQPCPPGTISLFLDLDADSIPGPGDQILASGSTAGMLPGARDTLTASVSLETGWYCLTGRALCSEDTTSANDAASACVAPGGGVPPVVSEAMANPLDEDCDEYVEIHYAGPGTFPLCGSSLTDGDAVDTIVPWTGPPPGPGAVASGWLCSGRTALVLDPEYPSGSSPYPFPDSTVVVTVANTTIGNGLTADDPVTLYGPWGTGIQDVLSTYGTPVDSEDPLMRDDDGLDGIPFDPGNGFSVERIHLSGPDAEFNWQASAEGGSPGSVPPGQDSLDLCLVDLRIVAAPSGSTRQAVTLLASVWNCGGLPASSASVSFFLDLDADSTASPAEVTAVMAVPYSIPGQIDTLVSILDLEDGCWLLGATVSDPDDSDPSNDTALEGFSCGEWTPPVISEVLCNPEDEDRDEFVEIWFPGPGVFDLEGCGICDGDGLDVITEWSGTPGQLTDPDITPGRFIPAGAYAVLLDPEYALGSQPWDFAPGTRAVTVSNTTIGDGLSGTDPLILYEASGTSAADIASTFGTPLIGDDPLFCDDDGLDSIPFDPGEGLSLHRITPSGPDAEGNWAAADPTPGAGPPSIQTGVDFSPVSILMEPPFGEEGQIVGISALVTNLGTESAPEGALSVWIYGDLDYSGTPSPSEIIQAAQPEPPSPGDTLLLEAVWAAPSGQTPLVVFTACGADSATWNDTLDVAWNMNSDIVINEIMYHPDPGEPEWLELFNLSESPRPLAGMILSDSHEEVVVTVDSIVLPPAGYIVITSDSAGFRDAWPENPCALLEPPSWPALNDQTQPGEDYADDVRLTLPGGQVLDMVPYDVSWGGAAGVSLEKTDPAAGGWRAASWSSCSCGGTPGEVNSVYNPGPEFQGFLDWWPDPFSPDGDGVDDVLTIRVEGEGLVTLDIFNVQGRLLRRLSDDSPSGGTHLTSWDGLDDDGRSLPVGRYIIHARLEGDGGEVRDKAAVVVLARHL